MYTSTNCLTMYIIGLCTVKVVVKVRKLGKYNIVFTKLQDKTFVRND
jgi:hypothetical protein